MPPNDYIHVRPAPKITPLKHFVWCAHQTGLTLSQAIDQLQSIARVRLAPNGLNEEILRQVADLYEQAETHERNFSTNFPDVKRD